MSDHPRGYDVAQYQKDVLTKVKQLVDDVKLRQWAIERAIEGGPKFPLSADQIYRFVTGALAELARE